MRILILIILSSFFYQCNDTQVKEELESSYKTSIESLTNNIDRNIRGIEVKYINDPKKVKPYYIESKKLDSIKVMIIEKDINLIPNNEAFKRHEYFSNKLIELADSVNSPVWKYNRERIPFNKLDINREEFNKYLIPVLYSKAQLLLVINSMTDNLLSTLASNEWPSFKIWEFNGVSNCDSTYLNIVNPHSKYDQYKRGSYNFEITNIRGSKGQTITNFNSSLGNLIWKISLPKTEDSVYTIDGKVYYRIFDDKIIELESFENKEVRVSNE